MFPGIDQNPVYYELMATANLRTGPVANLTAWAIDRAHRIGQTQPVIAYRMLTRSTIEEKIMTLQQKKNLMISNVLGEGGFTNLLQKEDF